jgi:DNA-3-methyladenine glycosylase
MQIRTKRVYEAPAEEDGLRVLIDRLWPRGISREKSKIDHWHKAVAPSNELRKWFHHEERKWNDFVKRYRAELDENADAVAELRELIAGSKVVTLLYGAKDEEHNQAVVLVGYLLE